MEYAAGGELFERICNAGRFSEDEVSNSLYIFILFSLQLQSKSHFIPKGYMFN
jgi:serine/threonine-protein kinase SRK2